MNEQQGDELAVAERIERVRAIDRRLAKAGFNRSLGFTLSDWERLLDMAELPEPPDEEPPACTSEEEPGHGYWEAGDL